MGLRRIPSEVRACQWEEMAYSLQYKPIRRINLRLQVPTGQIRITAPFGVSEASIGAFLAKNREWIRRQREKMASQPLPVTHRYTEGETIYIWGKPCTLHVQEEQGQEQEQVAILPGSAYQKENFSGTKSVGGLYTEKLNLVPEKAARSIHKYKKYRVFLENTGLRLVCPAEFTQLQRQQCVESWLKEELGEFLRHTFPGCEILVGKRAESWYIRKMKTRWGSCNVKTGRICINLNLVHLPPEYLTYIVIHELTHLWERGHGEAFKARMDLFYPTWRERRRGLRTLSYML